MDSYYRRGSGKVTCGPEGKWVGNTTCLRKSREACDEIMHKYVAVCDKDPKTEEQVCSSCGDAYGELVGGCLGDKDLGVTFYEAQKACKVAGGRLCTLEEVSRGALFIGAVGQANKPVTSLCQTNPVWTLDSCDEDFDTAMTAVTDPGEHTLNPPTCESKATGKALGMCCADIVPATEINECAAKLDTCDRTHGFCNYIWGQGYECGCKPGYKLNGDNSCTRKCPQGLKLNELTGGCDCCEEGFAQVSEDRKHAMVQQGKHQWDVPESDWELVSGGLCTSVSFNTRFSERGGVAYVLASVSHSEYEAAPNTYEDHDAVISWVENVDSDGFQMCVRNVRSKTATGYHQDLVNPAYVLTVNWVAYQSVGFLAGGEARFPEAGVAKKMECITIDVPDELPFSPKSAEHIQVTPNHRSSSGRHNADHAPVTVWVERFDQQEIQVCAQEPPEMTRIDGRRLRDLSVDWLLLPSLSKADGLMTGSVSLGSVDCSDATRRQQLELDALRLGQQSPCVCKHKLKTGDCARWQKAFEWVQGPGFCQNIFFREDEAEVARRVPTVVLTVDHRGSSLAHTSSGRVNSHDGGVATWIEWVTKRAFRVCYRDLGVHRTTAFDGRTVSWLAIL
jgi:hypothetical protein